MMKRLSKQSVVMVSAAVLCVGFSLAPLDASAGPGRGGGGHARTSVHGGGPAHRPPAANAHPGGGGNRPPQGHRPPPPRHVDVDVNRGWNHPVGTAVAIGATAAVVGSIIYSLPPSCTMVQSGGVTYQRCGSTWYQPRYSGSSVQYVVVTSPY
jgi:hypothetical protein